MSKHGGRRESQNPEDCAGNGGYGDDCWDNFAYFPKTRDRSGRSVRQELPQHEKEQGPPRVAPIRVWDGYDERLLKEVNEIFSEYGPADLSRRLLAFIKDSGRFLSVVNLSDLFSRLGRILGSDIQVRANPDTDLLKSIEEIFGIFAKGKYSSAPRELSNCIRVLGSYFSFMQANQNLDRMCTKENTENFNKILRQWGQSLDHHNPDIADLCGAVMGMTASRLIFDVDRKDGWDVQLGPFLLKKTCDSLASALAVSSNPLSYEDLRQISAMSRYMARASILSKSLMEKVVERFWGGEIERILKSEDSRAQTEGYSPLSLKICAMHAAAAIECFDDEKAKELKEEVFSGLKSEKELRVSLEALGELLIVLQAHGLGLNQDEAWKIEGYIKETLPDGWENFNTHLSGMLKVIGILGVARNGKLTNKQKAWVDKIKQPRCNNNKGEKAMEYALGELRDEQNIKGFISSSLYAIHQMDFLVTVVVGVKPVTINLELDGFPYHSIFDIDSGKFLSGVYPLKNKMRDLFVETRYPVLRLRTEHIFDKAEVRKGELLRQLRLKAAAQVK
jgi:hypothetical protein